MENRKYNSRVPGAFPGRTAVSRKGALPVEEPAPGQSSGILEKFRGFLKEREEEMEEGSDDEMGTAGDEIAGLFEEALGELTFNSKYIITDLTIIAGEQVEHSRGIADAICRRIVRAPADQKLPSLYLLDSIVKNIGGAYVKHFSVRLPEVFCKAYKQVDKSLHTSLRHLFRTWSGVFPSSVLRAIEAELEFSPTRGQASRLASASPLDSTSVRLAHGIHVNPKYLESRLNMEHPETGKNSRANLQIASFEEERDASESSKSPRGWSGASKFHGTQNGGEVPLKIPSIKRKPADYGVYSLENGDAISPKIELARSKLPRVSRGGPSFSRVGPGRLVSPSRANLARPISPSGSSSPPGGVAGAVDSPGSEATGGTASFHSTYDGENTKFGLRDDWNQIYRSNDGGMKAGASSVPVYNQKLGLRLERKPPPKALIDAYGDNRSESTLQLKIPKVDENGVNAVTSVSRNWQNSDLEEYVWEDMSPTLSDRSKRSPFMSSDTSLGTIGGRTHLRNSSHAHPEGKNKQSELSSKQILEYPMTVAQERNSMAEPGSGTISRDSLNGGDRDETATYFSASRAPQGVTSMPSQFSHPLGNLNGHNPRFLDGFASESNGVAGLSNYPMTSVGGRILDAERLSGVSLARDFKHSDQLTRDEPLFPASSKLSSNVGLLEKTQSPSLSELDAIEKKYMIPPKFNQLSNQHPGAMQYSQQEINKASSILPLRKAPLIQDGLFFSGKPIMPLQMFPHTINSINIQAQIPVVSYPANAIGISPAPMLRNGVPATMSLPPLPPGPPPIFPHPHFGVTPQILGPILPNPPAGNALSGFISSLVGRGFYSLVNPIPSAGSIGLEFNENLLKVRNEHVIESLYTDLPRQCTTCGMRFKLQEEHSSHMDWHVTKNRNSRNRNKQQSRKYFSTANEFTMGMEGSSTDVVPRFLPVETVLDKKEEEVAVPADDDQQTCALCGERFDDFYSDEAEEWMFRGAVYLNATEGVTYHGDRSVLGPIVHLKCKSGSTDCVK